MSYSSLSNYRYFTGHYSKGRGGKKITKIAIHHMAGNLTVAQCGNVFANNQVSAHYGINGNNIGVYVDESNTAWALGNFDWNQRSINIELANSTTASGGWKVSDATIQTCIKLVADIAYRLGWTYVSYTGNTNGDVIAHRWIASTSCPGPYMINNDKLRYIANEADKLLKAKRSGATVSNSSTSSATTSSTKLAVDGKFGTKSCAKMQKWLGAQYRDGILSGQLKSQSKYVMNLGYCVQYGSGGSHTVRLLQRKLGVTADGYIGVNTIKALQKFLNNYGAKLKVDGYAGSATISEFQRYLNSVA